MSLPSLFSKQGKNNVAFAENSATTTKILRSNWKEEIYQPYRLSFLADTTTVNEIIPGTYNRREIPGLCSVYIDLLAKSTIDSSGAPSVCLSNTEPSILWNDVYRHVQMLTFDQPRRLPPTWHPRYLSAETIPEGTRKIGVLQPGLVLQPVIVETRDEVDSTLIHGKPMWLAWGEMECYTLDSEVLGCAKYTIGFATELEPVIRAIEAFFQPKK
jgi:hypothetical protein